VDVRNGGGSSYCLYRPPTGVTPLGVILYNHGAQLFERGLHDPMAQWLAQRGYYVVYPHISNGTRYPTQARNALSHALEMLRDTGTPVDRVAVAGFSLGALAAVRVAATWNQEPPIRAIVLHEPAGMKAIRWLNVAGEYDLSPAGLRSIRCDTRLLIVQAQSSAERSNSGALPVWNALSQLAKYAGKAGTQPNRNFLLVPHDSSHQNTAPFVTLRSEHQVPTAIPLTSMDWHGYWLALHAAVFEAFFGTPGDGTSSLCNTSSTSGSCASTRSMGRWLIDGAPATPMSNAADLDLLRGFPSYCAQ
jgi:pimeloyl-ACP methyl ester carboxylesterase